MTQEQRRAYHLGREVKIYLDDISVPIYKLLKNKGYDWMRNELGFTKALIDKRFLGHLDRSLVEGDDSLAASAAGQEGYVVITDGSLETVITK